MAFAGSATDPDGDPVTLTWDFGDGKGATGPSPAAHAYAVPAAVHVTLTARDPNGGTGTATLTVNVVTPAPAAGDVGLLLPVVLEATGVGGSHYTFRGHPRLARRRGDGRPPLVHGLAGRRLGLRPPHARAGGDARPARHPRLAARPGPPDSRRRVDPGRDASRDVPGRRSPGLVFAGARTFTPDPARAAAGRSASPTRRPGSTTSSATLFGLQQNASQRSNVAVVNAGAVPSSSASRSRAPTARISGPCPTTRSARGAGTSSTSRSPARPRRAARS